MFSILGIIWVCMMLFSLVLVTEVYDMKEESKRLSIRRGTRYMSILIEVNQNAILNNIEDNYVQRESINAIRYRTRHSIGDGGNAYDP